MLDSNILNYQDGALNTLQKICEDIPVALDSEQLNRPLNDLIPRFIQYMLHNNPALRRYAVGCLNMFLFKGGIPQALISNMDKYLRALFMLAQQDNTKDVKKRVCTAFVNITEVRIDLLSEYMNDIINFILEACQNEEESVALEACEFWNIYCENDNADLNMLKKHLPKLITVLLRTMVYSEMDLQIMGADEPEDNENVVDKPEDIKPTFHKAKLAGNTTDSNHINNSEEDEEDDLGDEDGKHYHSKVEFNRFL
jgi:transportin-1